MRGGSSDISNPARERRLLRSGFGVRKCPLRPNSHYHAQSTRALTASLSSANSLPASLAGGIEARTGLRMMPTSPRSPLHSVRRVFPSTAGRLAFRAGPSPRVSGLSLLPAYTSQPRVCVRRSCSSWGTSIIPLCVGSRTRYCTAWWIDRPPPQGPSLGSGLFCPGPSSLNRPHPPHSQAHRDFTARRLIRNALAVRERLGDPRVVPSFRCTFRPGMPSSQTPGSSTPTCPEVLVPTSAFAMV